MGYDSRDGPGVVQGAKFVVATKALRELISYRVPSSGDSFLKPDCDVFELCRLLIEVAQLQSEILDASVTKNVRGTFHLIPETMAHVHSVEIEGIAFEDNEDFYRIGYLARKHPRPTTLLHVLSEGHVEDYFGAWCAQEPDDGDFDPDDNWHILFDLP